MKQKLKKLFLLLGDIFVLFLSLYFALSLRYLSINNASFFSNHGKEFAYIFLIWIIVFYIFDLYNLNIINNSNLFFHKTYLAGGLSGLLSFVYFYLKPNTAIAPKTILLIFIFVFLILFILWRKAYTWILKTRLPKNNIAIIGNNKLIKELLENIKNKPQLGYEIKFIIDENNSTKTNINNIPIFNDAKQLNLLIKKHKISNIVLIENIRKSPKLRSLLFSYLPLGISIINFNTFYEEITGKIPINNIDEIWFLENLNEGNKKIFDFIKRTYDFIFALLIFLFSAPFWPIIGIIIKLQSKGPIFFKQERLGKNNNIFHIIKFRTMHIEQNDFKPTQKNDNRVFKFGSFMRKTRIDEIPQVLNILFGTMSFIGPRPEQPKLAKELAKQIPFYYQRNLIKPGLSGWDQISGEYHSPSYEDTVKKLQYDLYYIKNRSIYLDISIALKTLATIFSRQGI